MGIVAAVSSTLTASSAFIIESSHFGDADTGLFFMRTVFRPVGSQFAELADFRAALAPVAKRFEAQMNLVAGADRMKVLIAVSKHGHCLNHLLHHWQARELSIDIVGVVSNHEDMRRLVEWHDIPYHHLPIVNQDKAAQEANILELVANTGAQLTVLARYMQVLSDDLCRKLEGRCINIHHSFLPSFKGAKPYHQAHSRGVKVIGATAHYVTADLDEGPIIEQDTVRVDHSLDADDFVQVGKDVESMVLARAVRWHSEHRILRNGQRTVVFKRNN
jgi:formyltetrahydrofolate deformylase